MLERNPSIDNDQKNDTWLEELVESFLPKESDIPDTPLKNASAQRLVLKEDLKHFFLMPELSRSLEVGLAGFYEYLDRQLDLKQKEQALADLKVFTDNFQECRQVDPAAIDLGQLCGLSATLLHTIEESGEYYFNNEQFAQAGGIYTMLTLLHCYEPRHWLRKGLCYQALSDFHRAIASFEAARQLAVDDPGPLLMLASCSHQMGDHKEADAWQQQAQKAMRSHPEYRETWGSYLDVANF